MKKMISTVLILALVFSLCACGKTEAAKAWEEEVAKIETGADYSLAQIIAGTREDYNKLTDEEKGTVKLESFEKLEAEFFNLPCSPVKCAEYLKKHMKDPSSFRIYGDVIFITFSAEAGEYYLTAVVCDAKNGYGAYNGKSSYEIMATPEDENIVAWSEDDSYFLDMYDRICSATEDQAQLYADHGITYAIFDGKRIAEYIDCEYFD